MKKFLASAFLFFCGFTVLPAQQPNIILVICDDLNYSIDGVGGHPQAITPNLDAFAAQGVSFSRAQCNAPICGPSRASLISGLYPHTTGMYGYEMNSNKWHENAVISTVPALHGHFKNNGYTVYSTGKMHHSLPYSPEFDVEGIKPDHGPWPWNGIGMELDLWHPSLNPLLATNYGPLSMVPVYPPDLPNGIPGNNGWVNEDTSPFDYVNTNDRDSMVDEKSVNWAASVLRESHTQPFFLTVGFMRPHSPFYVPQEYFDLYDTANLQLAEVFPNDLDDVSTAMIHNSQGFSTGNTKYQNFLEVDNGGSRYLKEWTHSYLACVSFVDHQFGKLMDSLNASPYAGNTIVVFTSDHGMHLGEKEMAAFKNTAFGESSRIPLMVKGPGIAQEQECKKPVSLVDLYPTLVEYSGIPDPGHLEGHSVAPFLTDPVNGSWTGPSVALTAQMPMELGLPVQFFHKADHQHFSVTSEDYRYTLTASDEEELYDLNADPHNWFNLKDEPGLQSVKLALRAELINMTGRRPFQTHSNLLYNGGFEDHLSSWNLLMTGNSSGEYRADSSDYVEGGASLSHTIDVADNPWNTQAYSNNLALDSGETYQLSFWAKAGINGSGMRAIARRVENGNNYNELSLSLTTTWQKYDLYFTPDLSTNRNARVSFQWSGEDTYHLDAVQVRKVVLITPSFCNGDFEQDYENWTLTALNGATIDFGIDSVSPGEASKSACINVHTMGSQPTNQQITSTPDNYSCLDSIYTGETYRLVYKARSGLGSKQLKLVFGTISPAITKVNVTNTITDNWAIYTSDWLSDTTIASEEMKLKLQFRDTGAYYIDSVFIRNIIDCNGDLNGSAITDPCGFCINGNTGMSACVSDCNGDWGGTAFMDDCGICVGGNTGWVACVVDCNGESEGTAFIDSCGICVGGSTGLEPCIPDCYGDWGGLAIIDSCGLCTGGNTGNPIVTDVADCEVGIVDLAHSAVRIYPNPFDHSLTIEGNVDSYKVYNILGQEMSSASLDIAGNQMIEIQTNHYPSGTYHIVVEISGKLYRQKLIKK